ncbi:hypothetical protein [Legionella gresilensis]|uniref:hypothetical protein n=1 Tax=Legionella gresilensis TaxID=91823 RepID=UPI001041604C|nr:hypothetical protein [Legionella gresilensis]
MFKTFTSIYMNPASKKVPSFFNRNLSTTRYAKPHSSSYLAQQLAELKARNIKAEITTLKKGTTLTGLDMHFDEHLLLDAYPLYKKETLNKLSPQEKGFFQTMGKDFYSRFASFTLKEDVQCLKTKTPDTNSPFFYIHRDVTKLGKAEKIDNIISSENNTAKPNF